MGFVLFLEEILRILIDPILLLSLVGATLLGIVIGALPGLTASIGIGLAAGLTVGMPLTQALLILLGIYIGAIYGGAQSAILINIPGTPSAAATAVDGFPLAKKGQAGPTIGIATISSSIGTIIGLICLVFLTPIIAAFALEFTSPDFFLLAVCGIVICGNLTSKDPIKGWLTGFLGMMIGTIGMDGITGYPRFTFGFLELMGGITLIPALIGLFGVSEILFSMKDGDSGKAIKQIGKVFPNLKTVVKHLRTSVISGLIGTGIGVIPGVGEDIAAWVSYDVAKRRSKNPEEFGKGNIEGVIAAETGNNACIGGAIIPVLTLGIPGSAPAAVLMGALMLHGIRVGPMLIFDNPNFLYQISAILFLSAIMLVIIGLPIAKVLVPVLSIPKSILMPLILVLCVIGTYTLHMRIFDVYLMLALGLIGYFLRMYGFPAAPLCLGIVLTHLADDNLRRTLIVSEGSLAPFFTRPISLVLLGIIILMILSQNRTLMDRLLFFRKKNSTNQVKQQ